MLLAMMMLYTPPVAAAAPAAGATALGPEFVVGDVPGGQHCETWTGNLTNMCPAAASSDTLWHGYFWTGYQ